MLLAHGIMGKFLLKHGHLGYYVMRLWILFKSCILSGFLWYFPLSCFCQVGVPGSPISFCWHCGREVLLFTDEWTLGFPLGLSDINLAKGGVMPCYGHAVVAILLFIGSERPSFPLGFLRHQPVGEWCGAFIRAWWTCKGRFFTWPSLTACWNEALDKANMKVLALHCAFFNTILEREMPIKPVTRVKI